MAKTVAIGRLTLAAILVAVGGTISPLMALFNEPFSAGSVVGHLGTIMYENGTGSRCNGLSSVYLSNKRAAGVGVSGVSYYDGMDNFADRKIAQLSFGGWMSGERFACGMSVAHFDAMGAYYEQYGYLSLAVVLVKGIKAGCAVRGTRMNIYDSRYSPLSTGTAQAHLLLPFKPVFITLGVDNVVLTSSHITGADPAVRYECGIHTSQHAFGAQGVRIVVVPAQEVPVMFSLGQEIRLHKRVALHAAISSNPFLFAMGIEVGIAASGVNVAMVSHPVLGWSKGFSMEYLSSRR